MSVNHRATFYSIHFQPHKLSVSFLHNVRGDNAFESYEGPTVLTQHILTYGNTKHTDSPFNKLIVSCYLKN